MNYFSQIPGQDRTGPWTLEELSALFANGSIGPNTPCQSEQGKDTLRFQELYERERGHPIGKDLDALGSQHTDPNQPIGVIGSRPTEGQTIGSHLMLPWEEFRSGRWLRHRRAVLIAGVGLLPLFVIAFLGEQRELQKAYWAVALYFSVLWASFFYHAFPAPGVNLRDAAFCFFGSAFSCTLLLYFAYHYTPIRWLIPWIEAGNLWQRWLGFVGAAGLAEESCKAVILVLMFRRQDRLNPHS